MGRVLLLFTVLCSVLFVETAVDIQGKKEIVFKTLGNCRNQKKYAMTWQNVVHRFDNSTKIRWLDLEAEVSKEIINLSIVLNFWKCDASGNPDSCEVIVQDYNFTDVCTHMLEKNEVWTIFMDKFTVMPKCPIQPGIYPLRKCIIDSRFLKYLPIGDALWKLQLEGYDRGGLISCVEMVLQIVSRHDKKRKS